MLVRKMAVGRKFRGAFDAAAAERVLKPTSDFVVAPRVVRTAATLPAGGGAGLQAELVLLGQLQGGLGHGVQADAAHACAARETARGPHAPPDGQDESRTDVDGRTRKSRACVDGRTNDGRGRTDAQTDGHGRIHR